MRYIKKTIEPTVLTTYKNVQAQANLSISYDDFREKRQLNEILRSEQHSICCYCQQKLTHFQGDKIGGAHNEHLIPQDLDLGDGSIELDYQNIYACCIDSEKQSKSHRHCGEAKSDNLIRGFIQEPNCNTYFRYNMLGEILPNGTYAKWEEYTDNNAMLEGGIKDAYDTIKVLNLNCHKLVRERKDDATTLLTMIKDESKADVNRFIVEWEKDTHYFRYIDMLLYYMRLKR